MNLARLAALTRAIGAGCGAFADSLDAQLSRVSTSGPFSPTTAPPERVSPQGQGADTLDASDPSDGAPAQAPTDQPADLASAIRDAMPVMVPPSARRKRNRKLPARYRPDGTLGADWVDEELGPMLSQRGVGDWLDLARPHVLALEQAGRLERFMSQGKVGYKLEQVEALAEMVRARLAGNQEVTPEGNAHAS